MLMSVFSFVVAAAGDSFIIVVLLSFFSAGGLVTVVSFCSQAVNSARPASRQMYFFIPTNRISEETLVVSSFCFIAWASGQYEPCGP
jgi:hypothetical protein